MNKYILTFIIFSCSLLVFSQELSPVYPLNNFITSDSLIKFTWNTTNQNGYSYDMQISTDTSFNNIVAEYNLLSDNYLDIDSFNINKKYFWRIRAFNGTNYSNWNKHVCFTIYNPNNINTIGLWLNADSSNITFESGKVKMWKDLSFNNNNLYQNDISLQPSWEDSIINNKPCISFASSLDYLIFTDTIDTLGGNLFCILKNTNTNGSYFIGYSEYPNGGGLFVENDFARFWYNGNRHSDISFTNDTDFVLLSVKQDTTNYGNYWESYYSTNKVNLYLGDSISSYGYHFAMNWLGTTNWYGSKKQCDGYLAELIYFYSPLNDSLYYLNEQYLRYKYAPPANLGYDIHIPHGFCDTTINAGARFTNYLWSTGDTTQTITVNQPGQYSVTVTDIFGFESSDSLMVYYPTPTLQTDSTVCFGDTIKWNAGLQDTNYTFLWQDNSNDSILPIFSAGNYYVQITDTNGCSYNSDTAHITIDNYPITTSLGSDDTLCAGQSLYLEVGDIETINYLWSNGDTTDYIIINSAGDYSITTTNSIGCIATDTINIQIRGYAPIPGFDYTNTCFNDNTIFTDTSTTTDNSNIISWDWNFGNGNTSIAQHPNIQYLDTGNYQVILTVTTDSACENTITKNIRITPLPIANYNNTQLCEKNDIQFTNLSTVATGNITNSLWNFGNGDTTSSENPIYTYNNYGNYTIQLQVTTDNNCKDTLIQNIEVKPSPETDFYFGATCKGEIVNFYNNTSTLVYNQVLEYLWNFGDGNNSTNENVNHLFNANDTINTVSLYAKTVNGCSYTTTKQITMHNIPVTKILAEGICQKNQITLTEDSYVINDTITSYNWQVNDQFYTEQNPTITINDAGNAIVVLKVSSINGCIGTDTKQIPVYELPNSDFEIYPEYGIVNEITNFIPSDTLENIWNFGNGTISTDTIAYTIYSDSGTYTINHYTTNHYNCTDSVAKQYLVVVPRQDIAITNIETEIKNNKLYTSVNVINLGNLPIYNIEFTVNPENQSPITENWTGELLFGGVLQYTFNSIYNIAETPSYVCVTANLIGKYPDKNPIDNTKCTNENTDFELFPIYPNPTSDYINIKFGLPDKGNVDIKLIDNLGKTISLLYSQKTEKGISVIYYNLPKLNDGTYTIQVKYNNILKSMKFIKTTK